MGRRTLSCTSRPARGPQPRVPPAWSTGPVPARPGWSVSRVQTLASPTTQLLSNSTPPNSRNSLNSRKKRNSSNNSRKSATPATQLLSTRATTPRSHFVRLFVTRGPAPSPRPPSSSTQKLLEGGVPSRSPSTPPRSGDGGVSFGSEPGKSFPQKEAPPSHEL